MKRLYLLGNWKSNKTFTEALQWKEEFEKNIPSLPNEITVIICPAFSHLGVFSSCRGYALGAQNVSSFGTGAYTGEVAASMLGGVIEYCMVGHSERRKNFLETDEIVAKKAEQLIQSSICPVVCVSEVYQAQKLLEFIPEYSKKGLILYEPLFAIGSGKSDTPENANKSAQKISDIFQGIPILYGGSVTPENVKGFVSQKYIHGVGVGGASLDPVIFSQLINQAISS